MIKVIYLKKLTHVIVYTVKDNELLYIFVFGINISAKDKIYLIICVIILSFAVSDLKGWIIGFKDNSLIV